MGPDAVKSSRQSRRATAEPMKAAKRKRISKHAVHEAEAQVPVQVDGLEQAESQAHAEPGDAATAEPAGVAPATEQAAPAETAIETTAGPAAESSVNDSGNDEGDNVSNAAAAGGSTSDSIVALASNCTVKDAAALKDTLCAVLDSDVAITLDISSVERIDTATIQVLCAFVRQRGAAARSVVWSGTSDAVEEAARLLGVRSLLALPAANAGGAA